MPDGDTDEALVSLHRHTQGSEIYFLVTQEPHAFDTSVSFRIAGRVPTAWDPMTGERTPVSYDIQQGVTTIPLHFEAEGSTFIVFAAPANTDHQSLSKPSFVALLDLSQAWTISYPRIASSFPCQLFNPGRIRLTRR